MTDEIERGEWRSIRVGTHYVQIANRDGEPYINVRDHASIAVDGEHKDNPTVFVERGEFPTDIHVVDEGALWERYEQ